MSRNDPSDLAASHGQTPHSKTAPDWWGRTPILAVIIFAAIVLNDAHVIFQSYQYETNDVAANSLQILEAKRFHNTLGNYSRFGFHHPGPAFFYVYALGEALFYDATHLVPTPFNAQFIALDALSAFFFSATLAVIARRLGSPRSRWFLGISLLLAAWHFGAVGRFFQFIPGGLFCIWPPCVLVLPFLCFLVAAAAVASGAGRDLPLMTLAGCFLVHGHVGQPLFVVPIALLAYGGLLYHLRRGGGRRPIWPWQTFPRQHWFAGAFIAAFLVPIVIDIVTAHPNNIRLILNHIQAHSGERKEVLRSLLYFLHFGAYSAYPNSNFIPALDAFDAPGTALFFRTHWRAFGLWLMAAVVPMGVLAKRAMRPSDRSASAGSNAHPPAEIDATTFLSALYVVLGSAVLLTIVWGCIQDGPMFYFNSLFNFAIYYGFLLIFAIVAALWIDDHISARHLAFSHFHVGDWHNRIVTVGPIMIALAAITVLAQEARQFRSAPPDQNQQRMFAASIERALRIDPAQPKLLIFEWSAWAEAVGVALYLERTRCPWNVVSDRPLTSTIFGSTRAITGAQTEAPANSSAWRILPKENTLPLTEDHRWNVLPLSDKADLAIQSTSRNGTHVEN